MFGKKSNGKHQRKSKKDYNLFPISQPWGYYPDAVHEKILSYENALNKLNTSIETERRTFSVTKANLEKEIQDKDDMIKSLQAELRQMHMQMSNLELPEADFGVSYAVLDQFKNYNNGTPQNHSADVSKRKVIPGKKIREKTAGGNEINIVQ